MQTHRHTQVAFTCENACKSWRCIIKAAHIGTVTIVLRDSINWILNGILGDATSLTIHSYG